MELHLIGGFLGSGKTTAVVQAAKQLLAAGYKVGVITNDQGKYLVDTAFVRLSDLPAVEVTGGCFCCQFDDLDQQLHSLIQRATPDIIFAESVGSCADIVATIVKPLLALGEAGVPPASFSVFVDSRLYLHHLMGHSLPFSDDVVYIFEKQIEEAGLLMINKVDLLEDAQRTLLEELLQSQAAITRYRFQNSLSDASVASWLDDIQGANSYTAGDSLDLDYGRYGRGEARMAWLDEKLVLKINEGEPQQVLTSFFGNLLALLAQDGVGIGHLKFVVQGDGDPVKISFTGINDAHDQAWQAALPGCLSGEVHLLVNARVETDAERLHQYVLNALNQTQSQHRFDYREEDLAYFHPGEPRPTYRIP